MQPSMLTNSVMEYAPVNEHGVVALFTEWAPKKRIRINRIQSGFPDCLATLPTGQGSRKIRIEFEYKSSNFRLHGHDHKKCDWIVCWEHDWSDAPKRLCVVELRRYFGQERNVWMVPVSDRGKKEYSAYLRKRSSRRVDWSAPRRAHKGDLVLFYHAAPISGVGEVFVLTSEVKKGKKGWKAGQEHKTEWYASARRVAQLKAPMHLRQFRSHPVLKDAGFVRSGFRGRSRITEYWPFIHEYVVGLNPSLKKDLLAHL